jgi:cytochrome oxidase assembly protein ShyY1
LAKASKSDLLRWSGWLALVVAFSIACVYLSTWQFDRRQEALDAMDQVAMNYDAPIVDLKSIASVHSFDSKDEWLQVSMSGTYLTDKSVLVRNRPLNGQAGFLQLVPFKLDSGEVVAVERGWLAVTSQYEAPASPPLPSEVRQLVVGHVRPSEPTLDRSAPSGQLATINIDAFAESQNLGEQVFHKLYVRMQSESVEVANNPVQLKRPVITEGNHLSYALQWILFALMAITALIWGVKKEREAQSKTKKVSRRKNLGQVDAETEDSLLDRV